MTVGHKLTEDMVNIFNKELADEGTHFRIKWCGGTGEVILKEDIYYDGEKGQVVKPNDLFFKRLESFLIDKCGLDTVSYNNTQTTFWSIG